MLRRVRQESAEARGSLLAEVSNYMNCLLECMLIHCNISNSDKYMNHYILHINQIVEFQIPLNKFLKDAHL